MKIYNEFRASGNFGSMRVAKASKKEAVWAIFGGGSSPNGKKSQSKSKGKAPKLKKTETVTETHKKSKAVLKEEKQKESPKDTKDKVAQTTSQKKPKKDPSSGPTSPRSIATSTSGKAAAPWSTEKKFSDLIQPLTEKKKAR